MELYEGSSEGCNHCEASFKRGQIITVDATKGLTFCYSDAEGGCVVEYTFKSGGK